jgi:UDP-4-amino-4,6-dideoxy-N-acetyl-beta-L-altrosamine transaminase
MLPPDFIPYARQSIDSDDIREVGNALASQTITRGPKVEAFENAIAQYCDAKYAVAFSSGTSAYIAACRAANIGQNDRFLTTPNTFIATSGAAILCGASPIFIDIARETGNMNLELLAHNMNVPSTRGKTVVAPVHFAGIAVDMQKLDSLIRHPDTVVIEDAAHALGSLYPDGQKVGCCAWSHMTMFSFHPAKTITTGEGGMITTNDESLYLRLKRIRNNGIVREASELEGEPNPWYYEVHEVTNNYNFTEMQAALGLSQLARIDNFISHRRHLVGLYREKLKDFSAVRLMTAAYDLKTAFHLFCVQIDFKAYKTSRKEVMEKLMERGIGTQVHYIPLYRHPCLKKQSGDISEYFPEMEAYYAEALSLPLYYDLNEANIDRIVGALKSVLRA